MTYLFIAIILIGIAGIIGAFAGMNHVRIINTLSARVDFLERA